MTAASETTKTVLTQSVRRKLSLLHLAEELGNVSKACQVMGYHRDTFYEVRRAFQVGGTAALLEQRRGYNLHRSRQGYRLRGRTPAQALREALGVDTLPPIVPINTDTEVPTHQTEAA